MTLLYAWGAGRSPARMARDFDAAPVLTTVCGIVLSEKMTGSRLATWALPLSGL
jgi:hypothetical protein